MRVYFFVNSKSVTFAPWYFTDASVMGIPAVSEGSFQ